MTHALLRQRGKAREKRGTVGDSGDRTATKDNGREKRDTEGHTAKGGDQKRQARQQNLAAWFKQSPPLSPQRFNPSEHDPQATSTPRKSRKRTATRRIRPETNPKPATTSSLYEGSRDEARKRWGRFSASCTIGEGLQKTRKTGSKNAISQMSPRQNIRDRLILFGGGGRRGRGEGKRKERKRRQHQQSKLSRNFRPESTEWQGKRER